MKHRVLWIEDGAFAEMSLMAAPIYVSGKYDLVIALNAGEGYKQLLQSDKIFETIIVDIRLPPGNDEHFINLFNDRGNSKVAARLGLSLLKRVLTDGEKNKIPEPHRDPKRFGIFTVEGETELLDDLGPLDIKVCRQKTEMLNKNEVINLIEEIRKRSGK